MPSGRGGGVVKSWVLVQNNSGGLLKAARRRIKHVKRSYVTFTKVYISEDFLWEARKKWTCWRAWFSWSFDLNVREMQCVRFFDHVCWDFWSFWARAFGPRKSKQPWIGGECVKKWMIFPCVVLVGFRPGVDGCQNMINVLHVYWKTLRFLKTRARTFSALKTKTIILLGNAPRNWRRWVRGLG